MYRWRRSEYWLAVVVSDRGCCTAEAMAQAAARDVAIADTLTFDNRPH
jgi:hypothetical protein